MVAALTLRCMRNADKPSANPQTGTTSRWVTAAGFTLFRFRSRSNILENSLYDFLPKKYTETLLLSKTIFLMSLQKCAFSPGGVLHCQAKRCKAIASLQKLAALHFILK